MPDLMNSILFALTWLFFKHMIADYFLQRPYQFLNKGTYGHPGGLLHAAIHAGLSIPVFMFVPSVSVGLAAGVIVGEFMAHYHIDWSKEQITKKFKWTPQDQGFWSALGVDQFLHALTYLIMVWAVVGSPS